MKYDLLYKLLSNVYDLLDVIYFRNEDKNPRTAINDYIHSEDAVLDICTGTASNAIRIAKQNKNAEIVGIDMSADMIKLAKKKVAKEKVSVSLFEMDATDLKFKDEYFDIVIISLVLHEIAPSIAEKIILESKRVLKPEGKIIVMEWEVPKKKWQKLLFMPIHLLEPKSYKSFIRLDMKQYFEKFGLHVKEIKHCDYTKVIELVR